MTTITQTHRPNPAPRLPLLALLFLAAAVMAALAIPNVGRVLETPHETGVREWVCADCGRRLRFPRTGGAGDVLAEGDPNVKHSVGTVAVQIKEVEDG